MDKRGQHRHSFIKNHFAVFRAASELKKYMIKYWRNRNYSEKKDLLLPNSQKPRLHVGQSFTSYTFWSQVPYPLIAEKAKGISLQTIEWIRSYLSEEKVIFVIATIPHLEQVYVTELIGTNYNANLPQGFIEDFTSSKKIPYLDLLPLLRRYVRLHEQKIYIQGDNHFNNHGHYLVANYLKDWLKENVFRKKY